MAKYRDSNWLSVPQPLLFDGPKSTYIFFTSFDNSFLQLLFLNTARELNHTNTAESYNTINSNYIRL